jgi:hypothetical protein
MQPYQTYKQIDLDKLEAMLAVPGQDMNGFIPALIQRVRQEENNRDRCAARGARLERALTTIRLRLSASDDIGLGARVLLLNAIESALDEKHGA